MINSRCGPVQGAGRTSRNTDLEPNRVKSHVNSKTPTPSHQRPARRYERGPGSATRRDSRDRTQLMRSAAGGTAGEEEIMTAIRAVHVAHRQRASSQNGLPEPVPYVYGQQARRNAYAARIAQRNVQGWWQPPAALPEPKVTRPQAPAGTAAQVNLVRPPSGWAEILTVTYGELHQADLERRRSGQGAETPPQNSPH
jgi:hypothetical protein